MDAIRLGEGAWELDEIVERAEKGETVDIMREDRLVARVVPAEPGGISKPERPVTQEEWRAFLREIEEFASTLKYDPTNSVEQMRKQARY